MRRKIGIALIVLWLLSLVASGFGLVPGDMQFIGILLGAFGLLLLWPAKRRADRGRDD